MIRTPLAGPLIAALGVAAALATGARSENRPFEREIAGAQTKLAMPISMTPPVTVRGIDGAPAGWKLAERVAEALRSRNIPASAASRRHSDYVLKGEMRPPGGERNGKSRVEVVWSLYDGLGKMVGEVTQIAAVPGAAFRTPNEGVVEAMADAAAERIAPLVPSSSVHFADGSETGERRGNDRANLEERVRVAATTTPPPRPVSAPPAPAGDKKALTAVGRHEGASALSRNFFRPDIDPAKPLPLPQRVKTETTRPLGDSEESVSAVPEPLSDTGRRNAMATEPRAPTRVTPPQRAEAQSPRSHVAAPSGRPRQIAESPAPSRDARPEPRPEQYAERPGRAGYEYWIQVGSNKDEAASRAQWEKMQSTAQGVFANVGNRIQRADLGARGVYYRVQVGPFASPGAAGQFCAELKARQIECFLPAPEAASASTRPPEAAPKKAALPGPKPVAKPTEPTAPKLLAKPAEPKVAPKPVAKQAEPKPGAAPAEKPKEASAAPKKPDAEAPPPLPEAQPPKDDSAQKPDAPISTAPGLPGVLD